MSNENLSIIQGKIRQQGYMVHCCTPTEAAGLCNHHIDYVRVSGLKVRRGYILSEFLPRLTKVSREDEYSLQYE